MGLFRVEYMSTPSDGSAQIGTVCWRSFVYHFIVFYQTIATAPEIIRPWVLFNSGLDYHSNDLCFKKLSRQIFSFENAVRTRSENN